MPRLLPVRVAAVPPSACVEIALPSGVVVRLTPDAPPDAIAAIVRALA